MTTTIPTPQQILTGAVDLIESRGWCQGAPTNEGGALSITSAMRLATAQAIGITDVPVADLNNPDIWPEADHEALLDVFHRAANFVHYAYITGPIDVWNDAADRTVDDVLAALRAGAEEAGDPCNQPGGCGRDHGDCEGCDAPMECDEWRSGVCDNCYQARDEMEAE